MKRNIQEIKDRDKLVTPIVVMMLLERNQNTHILKTREVVLTKKGTI